jgi:hypothetical protein
MGKRKCGLQIALDMGARLCDGSTELAEVPQQCGNGKTRRVYSETF